MTEDPNKKPAAMQANATVRYVDRPECTEIFADSIVGSVFDGQTLRLEFGVTRLDEIKPNAPITGRRYPACRLALSANAAVELINRMQQIAALLYRGRTGKPRSGPAHICADAGRAALRRVEVAHRQAGALSRRALTQAGLIKDILATKQ